MVITRNMTRHLNEEDIEKYSLGELPGEQSAQFEEHLLICGGCRDRVEESDPFVLAFQAAGREIRSEGPKIQRISVSSRWMALLAAAALIAAMAIFGITRGSRPGEFAVSLVAMRGPEQVATAPANTPLVLHADLTGLAQAPSYRVEVVDATGNAVWSGSLPDAKLPARRPGVYFVRVFTPSHQLLREYGLRIR